MGLVELVAALERDARSEVERLAAGATAEAQALRESAREAARRREAAEIEAARGELGAAEAAALAEGSRQERLGELAARESLLARARGAAEVAARAAEPTLPAAALAALVAAARSYLPGAEVTIRCPTPLGPRVRQLVDGWRWSVAEAAGAPLAAIDRPTGTRVDLGLAAVLAARWDALAPGVLRALEGR